MDIEHKIKAFGRCPVDGSVDVYEVRVRTHRTIFVEIILEYLERLTREPVLQEDFTTQLAAALSADVTTVCIHSGVETTCSV